MTEIRDPNLPCDRCGQSDTERAITFDPKEGRNQWLCWRCAYAVWGKDYDREMAARREVAEKIRRGEKFSSEPEEWR